MTGKKVPNDNFSTDSVIKTPKSKQAAMQAGASRGDRREASREAREIFSNIEELVFDAIREDLKDDIETLVETHLNERPQLSDQADEMPIDERQKIRRLIEDYVQEAIEEQAPAIIARTLEEALSPPKPPQKTN